MLPFSGVSVELSLKLASSLQRAAVIPGGVEALAMSPASHSILAPGSPAWPRGEVLSSLSPYPRDHLRRAGQGSRWS